MSGRADGVEWVDRPLLLAMARAWWAQKMPASNCTKVQIKGDGRVDVWWCDSDESGRYTLPVTFLAEVAASATKAAVQAERDDRWQDIATAPKDGTRFLGGSYAVIAPDQPAVWREAVMWWDDHHHSDGWDNEADDVLYVGAWMAGRVGSFNYEEYVEECPTHWRPLPAPPRTPEAE